jgi:hypothetical protein
MVAPIGRGGGARPAISAKQAAARPQTTGTASRERVRALLSSEGWARWVRVRSRNWLVRYTWFIWRAGVIDRA